MKRSFRGNACAYCNMRQATSEDHVFGRKFLPEDLRGDLPKVPSCDICNSKKSEYERYAMSIFPFASNHPAAQSMLMTKVKRRLEKDQRLARNLRNGQKDILLVNPDGRIDTTIGLPFDQKRSLQLFKMIIKGLLWHHWRSPLPAHYIVRIFPLTELGLREFKEYILNLSPERIQRVVLAKGAFAYEFTSNQDDKFFSAWVLDIYDSMNMCGVTDRGQLLRVHVAALTGPPEIEKLADAWEKAMVQQSA